MRRVPALVLLATPALARDWPPEVAAILDKGSASLNCGSAGCGVDTLIDGTRGSLLLHDRDSDADGTTTYLTAPNDAGETVRFLWTGTSWQLQ